MYCNYQQDDWVSLLPLAEFAYNNSEHSTTHTTPFYANYALHPRFTINLRSTNVPAADERMRHIQALHQYLQVEILRANDSSSRFADTSRLPAPDYKVGDKVWLLRRHISTTRPSDKLDFKRLGPFDITKVLSPAAIQLRLPLSMQVHPVFHVSLLEPISKDSTFRPQPSPPAPIVMGETYKVEGILDSRYHYSNLQYLVLWEGYSTSEASWEFAKNVSAPAMLARFHSAYPTKPGPQLRAPRRR
jgi:hypothetical protein